MHIFAAIADWLIILAFLGLIITLAFAAWAAVRLTKGTVRNAKRLYERPVQAATNLSIAGRGIVLKETVRVQAAAAHITSAATAVARTATDLHIATKTLLNVDWTPVIEAVVAGVKFANLAAQVMRAASNQGPERSN